jgi:hypothetical protein
MRTAALACLAAAILGSAGATALRGRGAPRFRPLLAQSEPERQWPARTKAHSTSTVPELRTGGSAALSVAREFPGVGSGAAQGDPPDPVVGVGAGYVVQMVNDTVRVWTTAGVERATYALATFMQTAGPEVSDPRVVFDPSSRRWFASAVDVARASVQVAVSARSDPTGRWTVYSHATGSCPDQPSLGIGADLVIVGYGAFTAPCLGGASAGYLGGALVVYDKQQLLDEETAQPVNWGPDLDISPVAAVALTGGLARAVALVLPPPAGGPTYLVLLSVRGAAVTIERLPIDELPLPPPAEQAEISQAIETSDVRIQSAALVGRTLWTAGDVGCVPAGDDSLRSCLRMIAVTGNRIALDTDVGVRGRDLFYPALSADDHGDLAVVYGSSSSASGPGLAAFAVAGNMRSRSVTIAGSEIPILSDRFGDYFGAATDSNGRLWVTGETSETPRGDGTNWRTVIAELTHGAS